MKQTQKMTNGFLAEKKLLFPGIQQMIENSILSKGQRPVSF